MIAEAEKKQAGLDHVTTAAEVDKGVKCEPVSVAYDYIPTAEGNNGEDAAAVESRVRRF